MILPKQTRGLLRGAMSSRIDAGIVPLATCTIPVISGTRTHQQCTRVFGRKVCVNVPEFKTGSCTESGADCTDCFARCKSQFTDAGGWSIKSTSGETCIPFL
jgi:hypothetical protein